jgi:hypothetical protein
MEMEIERDYSVLLCLVGITQSDAFVFGLISHVAAQVVLIISWFFL